MQQWLGLYVFICWIKTHFIQGAIVPVFDQPVGVALTWQMGHGRVRRKPTNAEKMFLNLSNIDVKALEHLSITMVETICVDLLNQDTLNTRYYCSRFWPAYWNGLDSTKELWWGKESQPLLYKSFSSFLICMGRLWNTYAAMVGTICIDLLHQNTIHTRYHCSRFWPVYLDDLGLTTEIWCSKESQPLLHRCS